MKEGRRVLEKDPTLRRIVEVIVRALNPDGIILFGSRARGDYDDYSDYDILVLKRGIKPEERRKLESEIIKSLLKAGIFRRASVDIVVQDTDRFENLSKDRYLIYYWAHNEGIRVYEKSANLA